ncbi:STIP1 y and U box-containing protein 1 [Kappamyces sp. JEL0680]|nr:STIP1 y and U box-containing protein 1 [Kappamyces sp. JEL0680]
MTFLSLLFIAGPALVQAQAATCISLASSLKCPEYKDYSILSFTGVNSAADFDRYVSSKSGFTVGGCQAWRDSAAKASIRSTSTFICGYAVHYSTNLSTGTKCNTSGTKPKPICKTSAQGAASDVAAAITAAKCSASEQVWYPPYAAYVNSLGNTDCFLGIGDDVGHKCGFENAADGTKYCSTNASDICCTSNSNVVGAGSGNSTVATSSTAPVATDVPPSINPNITAAATSDSVPAPTTTASSQTSTASGGISPLIIGAGALGVALIAVLASVLFFMTKKGQLKDSNSASNMTELHNYDIPPAAAPIGGAPVGPETMECVFEYKANLFDELSLSKEGTFPMACLAPFGAGSEYGRDSRIESQYSKRASTFAPGAARAALEVAKTIMSAEQHKQLGNEAFKDGDFEKAIQEYTTAIIKNSSEPKYYTNRALALLRLAHQSYRGEREKQMELYEKVMRDSERAIELDPKSVKGFFYLGQAQLEMNSGNSLRKSIANVKTAYDYALSQPGTPASLTFEICQTFLKAKKASWAIDDARRRRENSELYRYLSDLVIEKESGAEERRARLSQLDELLEGSRDQADRRYEVPDQFVGKIDFEIMTDPVITPSGVTFDRKEIKEHFEKIGYFDPFTREPLAWSQIIPNLALKETIEQFLCRNGWAVDF